MKKLKRVLNIIFIVLMIVLVINTALKPSDIKFLITAVAMLIFLGVQILNVLIDILEAIKERPIVEPTHVEEVEDNGPKTF